MARQKDDGKGRMGGRQKGATNKTTNRTRDILMKFVEDNIDDVMKDLKLLKPKDRVKAFTDILKYVVPPARDKEAEDDLTKSVTTLVDRLFKRGEVE